MFEIDWIKNRTSHILLAPSNFSISIGHPETNKTGWNNSAENTQANQVKYGKSNNFFFAIRFHCSG